MGSPAAFFSIPGSPLVALRRAGEDESSPLFDVASSLASLAKEPPHKSARSKHLRDPQSPHLPIEKMNFVTD